MEGYLVSNANFVIGKKKLNCFDDNIHCNYWLFSGRVEREIIEDMKKVNSSGSSINRRHSMNSVPMMMRSIGRSNTAPLPNNESPDFDSSIYQDKSMSNLTKSIF